MKNKDIDFSRSMDFEVLGDIKPTIEKILGYYDTYMTSDCDLHLKGSGLSLPAYWKYLTYWAFGDCTVDIKIIKALLDDNLIKFHDFH